MSLLTNRLGTAFVLSDNPTYNSIVSRDRRNSQGKLKGIVDLTVVNGEDIAVLNVFCEREENTPEDAGKIVAHLQRLTVANGLLQLSEGEKIITETVSFSPESTAFNERVLRVITQLAKFHGYFDYLDKSLEFKGRPEGRMPELLVPIIRYHLTDCMYYSTGFQHDPVQGARMPSIFARNFYRQIVSNRGLLDICVPFAGKLKRVEKIDEVTIYEYETKDTPRFVSLPSSVPMGVGTDEDFDEVQPGQKVTEVRVRIGIGSRVSVELANKFSDCQRQALIRSWWLGRTVEIMDGFIHVPYRNCLNGYWIEDPDNNEQLQYLYDVRGNFCWRVDATDLDDQTMSSIYVTSDIEKMRQYNPLCASV